LLLNAKITGVDGFNEMVRAVREFYKVASTPTFVSLPAIVLFTKKTYFVARLKAPKIFAASF